jgi:hypothetical protein
LSAGDRVQIHELYARSVMLLELGRGSDWVALFTPLAMLRCGLSGEEYRGREALLKLAKHLTGGDFDVALGEVSTPLPRRHHLSNVTIFESSPGHAASHAFVTVTEIADSETPRRLASGRWDDQLAKCSTGCWQFTSRIFIPDRAPATAIPKTQATRL